jgi:hypothetical protein
VDGNGNVLVADSYNHRICCIDMTTKTVTTLAGTGESGFQDGPAARAQFGEPKSLAVDGNGNGNVLVADTNNHRIRCIDTTTKTVTTLAGTGARGFQDGPAKRAQFSSPLGLVVDGNGNVLVVDAVHNRIRCLDTATNTVTTLAGTGAKGVQDGPAERAQFSWPTGLAVDGNGNVLVADYSNHRIRTISGAPNVAPLPHGRFAVARVMPRGTLNDRLAAHRARLARAEAERASLHGELETEAERAEVERARLRAQLEAERARLQAQLDADMARLQARLDGIAAKLAAAEVARDDEATTVRELEVEVEGFRDRVATEGIEQLDTAQVYELLRVLDVTTVTPTMLERQEITGAALLYVTEDQMQEVFKMQRFGDRRRLSVALQRLANRQGFPPPVAVGQPGALGWGPTDVGNWLEREEFPALVARFAAEGIDGPCLLGLQAGDLRLLGVSDMTVGRSSRLRQSRGAQKDHVRGAGGAQRRQSVFFCGRRSSRPRCTRDPGRAPSSPRSKRGAPAARGRARSRARASRDAQPVHVPDSARRDGGPCRCYGRVHVRASSDRGVVSAIRSLPLDQPPHPSRAGAQHCNPTADCGSLRAMHYY